MRTKAILLCVLFTVGLAACGSSKSESSKATTTTSATPESLGPRGKARAMATATKLVLVASDFPPGWTSKPADQTQTPDAKASSKEVSDCVGTSGEESETARWNGDDFSIDQYQVSSEANLVKDDAVFRHDVDAIKGPKLRPCLKEKLTTLLTKELGTAPRSVEVAPLDAPKHGDVTVGVRLTVNGGAGSTDAVYFDLVLMGKNRAKVTATLISAGQPMDPALERSLVDALGKKVDAV